MLFLGLPKDNWEKYYFESLQDIKSNKKRFMEWAKNQPRKEINPQEEVLYSNKSIEVLE